MCRLRQLCLAGSTAVGCSPGAGLALELAGDARQRDHGQLRSVAGGISVVVCGVDHRPRRSLGTAQQFDRQWWISSGAAVADSGVLQLRSVQLTTNEQLDSLSYRTITVGFLLLTVGIISGAVWANEAWGSYWSWDPKETWALICWLVYAAYLHTRLSRGWQERRPALVAVVGLAVIGICYIGVNC